MIEFDCVHCKQPIRLSDDKAGVTGACPHCTEQIVVPISKDKQLHDDTFIVKKTTSEPIEIWDLGSRDKPQGVRERTVSFFGSLAGWIFGLIFFLSFTSTVREQPAISLIALVGALLLIPPAYKKISSILNKSISTTTKVSSAILLFILYGALYSNALSNTETANKAAVDLKTTQLQASRNDLAANKPALLKKANELLDDEKPAEAIDVLKNYQALGDPDVLAINSLAQKQLKTIADNQRQTELLGQLTKTPASNLEDRAKIYQELSRLAPANTEFKRQASALSEQVAQLAAKKKAAEVAEAALQYRRSQGLVWNYTNSQDDMSQKLISRAQLDSTNKLSFAFPYADPQRATLQLRKHPRWGNNVILMIERGQFLCNDYDGCSVLVRFGNGNPQRFSATGPNDNSTTYIFIRDYKNFVNQLKKTDEVTIEARFYQEGNRAMKFSTDGLNWN